MMEILGFNINIIFCMIVCSIFCLFIGLTTMLSIKGLLKKLLFLFISLSGLILLIYGFTSLFQIEGVKKKEQTIKITVETIDTKNSSEKTINP